MGNEVESKVDNVVESEKNNEVKQQENNVVESDLKFLDEDEEVKPEDKEINKEAERQKIVEGQMNSARSKIENGETNPSTGKAFVKEDFENYLQGGLSNVSVKQKSQEIDVDSIVQKAVDQVNSNNDKKATIERTKSLKAEILGSKFDKEQMNSLKSQAKEFESGGMAKNAAATAALKIVRLQSVVDGKITEDELSQMGEITGGNVPKFNTPDKEVKTMSDKEFFEAHK